MAEITLTSTSGLRLTVSLDQASSFLKYFLQLPAFVSSGRDLDAIFHDPLASTAVQLDKLQLSLARDVKLGAGGPELTVSGGPSAFLRIVNHGSLFADDSFGAPVALLPNQAYVGFGFGAKIDAGVTSQDGSLTFGFDSEAEVTYACYQRFNTTPDAPKVNEAIQQAIAQFSIPGAFDDLERMPVGSIATVEGSGFLRFVAQENLLAWSNPLASVSLTSLIPELKINASASLNAAVSYKISGRYQIRVTRTAAHQVDIAFYRKTGREVVVSASARLGAAATLGGTDLLGWVIGKIGTDPAPSAQEYKDAGLDPATPEGKSRIDAINDAIHQSANRCFEISLTAALAASAAQAHMFAVRIDLDQAGNNPQALQLLQQALQFNLTPLLEAQPSMPPGLQCLASVITTTQGHSTSVRFNLLGLLNAVSLNKFVLTARTAVDPETGDLLITDQACAQQIQLSTSYLTSQNRGKLLQLLARSLMVTVSYRASGAIPEPPGLKTSYWRFEQHSHTSRSNLAAEQLLLRLLKLGPIQPLPGGINNFGASTFYLTCGYDNAATLAMLLTTDFKPRPLDFYMEAARSALYDIVSVVSDPAWTGPRITALSPDGWPKVSQAWPDRIKIAAAFGLDTSQDSQMLALICGDYLILYQWAFAMTALSKTVADALPYFSQPHDPASPEFKNRRAQLQAAISDAVSKTHDRLDEPWDVVALDAISGWQARLRVVLHATGYQLLLGETS
jgi:hypothetical protein